MSNITSASPEFETLSLEEQLSIIKAEKAETEAKLKALEAQQKDRKGTLVEFTTSKGIRVKGYARRYWCLVLDNKQYLKQEDEVRILDPKHPDFKA
jgi:hypothetical protein